MAGLVFRGANFNMQGTTRCTYCHARFKVDEEQLEAHAGMVRCGHCRQIFDARPNFVSVDPSPQLELPILDEQISPPAPALPILQPMTLAEQVAIVDDEDERQNQRKGRTWPWAIASLLSLLLLLAQASYFFRVDLAARMPALKPALIDYCSVLKCDVPLPQHADSIDILSSGLEAIPGHEGRINLNALLRNRAAYAQAFPDIELTFTDSRDTPLARRTFRPPEYLTQTDKQAEGLKPNRELAIKLPLDTAGMKPMGYRLALLYTAR